MHSQQTKKLGPHIHFFLHMLVWRCHDRHSPGETISS